MHFYYISNDPQVRASIDTNGEYATVTLIKRDHLIGHVEQATSPTDLSALSKARGWLDIHGKGWREVSRKDFMRGCIR